MNLRQDIKMVKQELIEQSYFRILLNIHRCSINTCFTILKSKWRFIKNKMF